MKSFILAIDAGTSSIRAALYDSKGRIVDGSLNRCVYHLETDIQGSATIAIDVILNAFNEVLVKTLLAIPPNSGGFIKAVGVSFFWHSLVGLNSKNRAITPIITWADGRCRDEAEGLRKRWNEKKYHMRTGCMLRSTFWPAKISWLRKAHPQLFKRVKQWVSPAELILGQMTGERVLSHSMAAGTGLYDQREMKWSKLWMKRFGICKSTLPEISNDGHQTLPSVAQKYPQLKNALWFAGIGDGAASNLGLGANEPDLVAINFGTSAAIRILTPMPKGKIPEGLFCYRLDDKKVLVGGAITNAGIVHSWFERVYGLSNEKNIIHLELKKRDLNLISLPFLAPERSPTWCEELPGFTIGFQLDSTKEEHYQSMISATFLRLNRIRYILQKWSKKRMRYRLGGGLAGYAETVQKFADLFQGSVAIVEESEASMRGAAIYVLAQLGISAASPKEIKSYCPNLNNSVEYQKQTHEQELIEKEYLQFCRRCEKQGIKFR